MLTICQPKTITGREHLHRLTIGYVVSIEF